MNGPRAAPTGRIVISLRTRFILGVLGAGVLGLGGTAALEAFNARSDVESLAQDRGRVIANSVSANLGSLMVHGSGHQVQLFLRSVKHNALVSEVQIFNPSGVITASSSGESPTSLYRGPYPVITPPEKKDEGTT